MAKAVELGDALYELEQTTATLGLVQTAFVEGSDCINTKETADVMYMLYQKQDEAIKRLKEIIRK